jgi:hypothetical protein
MRACKILSSSMLLSSLNGGLTVQSLLLCVGSWFGLLHVGVHAKIS